LAEIAGFEPAMHVRSDPLVTNRWGLGESNPQACGEVLVGPFDETEGQSQIMRTYFSRPLMPG
jgi:hypothetical protein